jgi:hypothetical protein
VKEPAEEKKNLKKRVPHASFSRFPNILLRSLANKPFLTFDPMFRTQSISLTVAASHKIHFQSTCLVLNSTATTTVAATAAVVACRFIVVCRRRRRHRHRLLALLAVPTTSDATGGGGGSSALREGKRIDCTTHCSDCWLPLPADTVLSCKTRDDDDFSLFLSLVLLPIASAARATCS